ncbi:hypothetical protein ACFL2Q_15740 [Thermodesulfobacteriota bacterium]
MAVAMMNSEGFESVHPGSDHYNRLMNACNWSIDLDRGKSSFRYNDDDDEDYERALRLSTPTGRPVSSTCGLINRSLDSEGYTSGTVNMIVAPPGVGKSTFIVAESVGFIKQDVPVLHYVLGDLLSADLYYKYMANMLKTTIRHIP